MRKLWNLHNLERFSLAARDGEIGSIESIYFDDQEWLIRYFVVKTGGWLTGRKVLVVPGMISDVDEKEETINVDLTRKEIENAPPVETEQPVSRYYEEEFFHHYRLSPYWSDIPPMAPVEQPKGKPESPANPHLRSGEEVRNYRIQADDGDIGHIDDFILESPDWTIRYLEVDTHNWLPSKHVLISPTWLDAIDWASRKVSTNLQRETIRTAPPYDPKELNSREYQVKLYGHYGKSFMDE